MPVTLYSVYEPRAEAPDLIQRADRLAFVKEGFSWPALLVPVFWLIYQRMWIELALFVAVLAALPWVFGVDARAEALLGWASFALILLFAFEANDLRAAALERRGYRLAGVASGRGRDAAELAFFRSWLPQQAKSAEPVAGRGGTRSASLRPTSRGAGEATRSSGCSREREEWASTSPSSITARAISTPPPRRSSAAREHGNGVAIKVTAEPEEVAGRRASCCRASAPSPTASRA